MELPSIFKAYDVRGRYPEEIDEVTCHRIGAAFANFAESGRIVVGRDMRPSSLPLSRAFVEGVCGQGTDVIDIGEVSTDALYFASGRFALSGAMFTASHNPGDYNGIKFCKSGAVPVGEETGLADISRLAEQGVPPAETAGSSAERDVLEEFVTHVLSLANSADLAPLKVVVDAGNGMAGKMVPAVFDRTPVEIVPLYFELDGTFPNHPADPMQPENLADLVIEVGKSGADLGLAFDGDADRVFIVDEKGAPVTGSITAALVASRVLAKEPGATVVYGLTCSRIVKETIEALGGTAVRSRVGHSFIKQVMAESSAAFGGEHSGHYYFRDNFRADSGLICALMLLEALSADQVPMSTLLAPFRKYWHSGEINNTVEDKQAMLKTLSDAYTGGTQDWEDGLTVQYPDWWFNARPSNTEPVLRLNVEAAHPEVGRNETDRILRYLHS